MLHRAITSPRYRPLSLLAALLLPELASAGFIDDSHLRLETRNFYMNRDFRDADLPDTPRHDGKSQSKAEDWTQGFLLRAQSGYTEGTVGFGLDALGLVGMKLDSGSGTSGTGALRRNPLTGSPADEFSFLGLTGKVRMGKTVLTIGDHEPVLPVLVRNDTRLLPQTYQGVQVQSNDIDRLSLTGGQFRQMHQRDSSDYEDLVMYADGASGGVPTDRFRYAGAVYALTPRLTGTLYRSELKDNYEQNIASLVYTLPLGGDRTLKTDLRYFDSDSRGHTTVDNRYRGAMVTYSTQGHSLGLAYQHQSGDTGLPFLLVADPWAFNNGTYQPFVRADEDSWQLRYDYNFAAIGIPGLTLMARYIRADDFRIAGVAATERERNIDLGYVVQSGPLSGLGLRLRNVMYRGSQTTDVDENRVLITYTFNFW
ncbi:OprD family porin [Pseudomonas sp. X10]